MKERIEKLGSFWTHYTMSMCWTAHVDDEDGSGDALFAGSGDFEQTWGESAWDEISEKLSEKEISGLLDDCEGFLAMVADAGLGELVNDDLERAAHDFHLTRNGHGAGFWDGDWPAKEGRKLTEISKTFGSAELMGARDDEGELSNAYVCN